MKSIGLGVLLTESTLTLRNIPADVASHLNHSHTHTNEELEASGVRELID